MIVIKCNARLTDEQRRALEINIHDQAADGVIVLPLFCDLLNEVPKDEEIAIRYADGHPFACTGCSYRDHYAKQFPKPAADSQLLCPLSNTHTDKWIYCPNWPPAK